MNNGHHQATTCGASRKRKERDLDAPKAPPSESTQAEPEANLLLAGYLAHEFLSKGTLFGSKWDPARAQAAPLVSDFKKTQLSRAGYKSAPVKPPSYDDVASLLKTDGAHLPGILNPTQLALWLHM